MFRSKSHCLISSGVEPSSIAVQSPYMAQVQLLCDRIEEIPGAEGVQVASVDSFQGREADAVVVSMVMLLNHYACTLCICQPSNFFTDDNKQWTKLMRPTFYCTFPTSFKGKLLYQVSHSAKLMSNF